MSVGSKHKSNTDSAPRSGIDPIKKKTVYVYASVCARKCVYVYDHVYVYAGVCI